MDDSGTTRTKSKKIYKDYSFLVGLVSVTIMTLMYLGILTMETSFFDKSNPLNIYYTILNVSIGFRTQAFSIRQYPLIFLA